MFKSSLKKCRLGGSFLIVGRPDFVLASKLKLLKSKLKEWHKEEYGSLEARKKTVLSNISNFDQIQERRRLTEGELLEKVGLMLEIKELAKYEKTAWRQRSRTLWLKQGDKNTKFFHKMANAHRRYNHIDKLEVRGQTTTNSEEIRKEIIGFYQKLYAELETWRPNFNLVRGNFLSEEESTWLQREFEEQEVVEYPKSCASDKAPGPDGFAMGFFQKCWPTVKEDVMSNSEEFPF